MTQVVQFPPFREFTIGGKTRNQLLRPFDEAGSKFKIGTWARDVVNQKGFTTAKKPQLIKTGRAPLRAFGFDGLTSWDKVLKRAPAVGAVKLPGESAVHMRLQLTDQKPGDVFWVLMDPIADSGDDPGVLYVRCRGVGSLWLGAFDARDDFFPDDEVVFGLRE